MLRCVWVAWLRPQETQFLLSRSTRTRILPFWRSVFILTSRSSQKWFKTFWECNMNVICMFVYTVPLGGWDYTGHGIWWHHFPGTEFEDSPTTRLPASARHEWESQCLCPRHVTLLLPQFLYAQCFALFSHNFIETLVIDLMWIIFGHTLVLSP